jgi:hypothetical protein
LNEPEPSKPEIPTSVLPPGSFAPPAQARPILKMVSKLLKARLGRKRPRGGLTTGDVKVGHKKVKFW